ncbi:hypothetical protein HDU77_002787 [Chytriomyces hyalinus]|nr:hypothetical protein HDU77_002787 [Chytriomyces hyalinus]
MAATATKHSSMVTEGPASPTSVAAFTTETDTPSAKQHKPEKPAPQSVNHKIETEEILGSLPKDWEKATDDTGLRSYFVNHKKKTTSWIDPRTFHLRKHNIKDIVPGELPYGWEEVYNEEHNDYYYIDHQTEAHYWSPPWEKETRDKVIHIQKQAHDKAKAEKAAAKRVQKDSEALKEVDKHISDLELQRKVLNQVLSGEMAAQPQQQLTPATATPRRSTISKAEIEQTVQELRAKNAMLEAEHKKLLSDQQAKANDIAEIRNLIESERAQRIALESYILQVKQEMVESAALKAGKPLPMDQSQYTEPRLEDTDVPQEADASVLHERLQLEREERQNLKELTENLLKEREREDGVPTWVKELDLQSRNNRLRMKIRDVEDPERLKFKAKRDMFGKDDQAKLPSDKPFKVEPVKPRETGFGKVALEASDDVAKE